MKSPTLTQSVRWDATGRRPAARARWFALAALAGFALAAAATRAADGEAPPDDAPTTPLLQIAPAAAPLPSGWEAAIGEDSPGAAGLAAWTFGQMLDSMEGRALEIERLARRKHWAAAAAQASDARRLALAMIRRARAAREAPPGLLRSALRLEILADTLEAEAAAENRDRATILARRMTGEIRQTRHAAPPEFLAARAAAAP